MQEDLIYTAEQITPNSPYRQKKCHSFFNPSKEFVSSVGLLDPDLEISCNKNMNRVQCIINRFQILNHPLDLHPEFEMFKFSKKVYEDRVLKLFKSFQNF